MIMNIKLSLTVISSQPISRRTPIVLPLSSISNGESELGTRAYQRRGVVTSFRNV